MSFEMLDNIVIDNNIFFYVYIMIYTYKGKGGETHSGIVPMNNRPFTNETPVNTNRSFGKPNPIRHWRKQLFPYYETTSDLVTINLLETPSTVNFTTLDLTECAEVFEQIPSLTTCDGVKNENNSCTGGTNHIRRSGSTLYNKNYCSSTRQYLQKSGKTFQQNMMVGKPIDLDNFLNRIYFVLKRQKFILIKIFIFLFFKLNLIYFIYIKLNFFIFFLKA
jgi:hypothetical protein